MELFKKGMTIKELIKVLIKLPQDKPLFVASDEEQNILFKGFFIETYENGVVIAGLSGCEYEDTEEIERINSMTKKEIAEELNRISKERFRK